MARKATTSITLHYATRGSDTDFGSNFVRHQYYTTTFLVPMLPAVSFREIYGHLPQNAVSTTSNTYLVLETQSTSGESTAEDYSDTDSDF